MKILDVRTGVRFDYGPDPADWPQALRDSSAGTSVSAPVPAVQASDDTASEGDQRDHTVLEEASVPVNYSNPVMLY